MRQLDLRFADLASGSTRVFVTGQLSPDLFGRSLFQDSLEGAFELLHASSVEELEEVTSHIGIRSVRRLRDLLGNLAKSGLEAEFTWNAPTNELYEWGGSTSRIERLRTSLEKLTVAEPESFTIEGRLVTLSLKGRFEIYARSEDASQRYEGRFPSRLLEEVKQFRIGDLVKARLEARRIVNEATGAERVKHQLGALGEPSPFEEQ